MAIGLLLGDGEWEWEWEWEWEDGHDSGAIRIAKGGRHIFAAGLCVTALIVFFLYFKKANASFADHSLPNDALKTELAKWSTWHWARTVIIIAALFVSVSA